MKLKLPFRSLQALTNFMRVSIGRFAQRKRNSTGSTLLKNLSNWIDFIWIVSQYLFGTIVVMTWIMLLSALSFLLTILETMGVDDDTPKYFFSQKTQFDSDVEKNMFVVILKCYGYKTTPQ